VRHGLQLHAVADSHFNIDWQARLAESRMAEARQPIIVSTSGKKRKGATQKKPQPASGNGKGFG